VNLENGAIITLAFGLMIAGILYLAWDARRRLNGRIGQESAQLRADMRADMDRQDARIADLELRLEACRTERDVIRLNVAGWQARALTAEAEVARLTGKGR